MFIDFYNYFVITYNAEATKTQKSFVEYSYLKFLLYPPRRIFIHNILQALNVITQIIPLANWVLNLAVSVLMYTNLIWV